MAEDFLATVRDRYKRCVEADTENRERALEALRFRNLEQWDPAIKKEREEDKEGARPCLVLDKLNQHVNQVVNDERQNRPQIKVRPVDDKADIEVAKIYDGIVRHIQDASFADIAFDTGFEHAVDGGFGYWRVITDYCDEDSFDQDIKIKRVRNRFSVHLGPHEEPDGSDAKYGFVVARYTKDEFAAEFPGKNGSFTDADGSFKEWISEDWVLVAEYFYVESESIELALLLDKSVVPAKELKPGAKEGVDYLKKRTSTVTKIRWKLLTAVEELEEREWAGKWIPIVEVIGNELDIEGKVYRCGMLRGAMDSQRLHNFSGSAFAEHVALAPRSSWVGYEGQFEGREDEWKSANRRNIAVLQAKAVIDEATGAVLPLPQRTPPPGVPPGWIALMDTSEHGIQGSMGRYAASLGEPSNEKSGRAILARNHEGDVGTFHFQDNLSRSMRHTGRILVDLIPKILDTARIVRIIGEDGTPDHARIDPDLADEAGNKIAYAERKKDDGTIEKIYNLGVGKYDVTVAVGPSFTTRRQEAAEAMVQVVQAYPETMKIAGDVFFRSQDFPGAEMLAERFKKALPPGFADEDEDADVIQTPQGPIPVDQAGMVIGQLTEQLKAVMQDADRLKEQNRNLDLRERGKELLQKDEEIALKKREVERQEAETAAKIKALEEEAGKHQAETQNANATQASAQIMAQGVEQIAQAAVMLAQAAQAMSATNETVARAAEVNAAASAAAAAATAAPRQISLVTDHRGMPVGAVSTVQ